VISLSDVRNVWYKIFLPKFVEQTKVFFNWFDSSHTLVLVLLLALQLFACLRHAKNF